MPLRCPTHQVSSLRKQGPSCRPARAVTWVLITQEDTLWVLSYRDYNFTPFSLSALPITLTELSAIAAAAIIGDSSQPVNG